MILELGPDSSPIARAAAATILSLHITAGLVALIAGAGALVFRKGSRLHRLNGNVFVVSMVIMATIGAAVSPFLEPPQWVNVVAGTFTVYLVVSAWFAARHRDRPGLPEKIMFAVAAAIACSAIAVGLSSKSTNPSDVVPAFVFASVVTLAAVGDLRLILRAGMTNVQRTLRHLWRMCYGLLIAAGSLFLGQPQVFPEAIRGTLFVPVVTVLGLMIYWFVRIRFAKRSSAVMSAAS